MQKYTPTCDLSLVGQLKHLMVGCDFANPKEKDKTVTRTQSLIPSQYRLVNRNGILTLQGLFQWTEDNCGGVDWMDIPTVYENVIEYQPCKTDTSHVNLTTEEDKKIMEGLSETASVEKINNSLPEGTEEGDICGVDGCNGVLGYNPVKNCSCHISPPCHACVSNPLVCNECRREIQ